MKLKLTLEVDYKADESLTNYLSHNLDLLVSIGMGDGILTGDSEAEVEEYKVCIEKKVVPGQGWKTLSQR